MKNPEKPIDIVCVGEALIDFIGHQEDSNIDNTKDYHRYLGGSPTNVAMNMARLGLKTSLVATIGKDGFGDYVLKRLKEVDVTTNYIKESSKFPTSTIFVSRTSETPDFIAYRAADRHITNEQIPLELLKASKVFHTTCFALSKKPAQKTILQKAKEAFELGCKLSIDINYSNKIWSDREEAHQIICQYCAYNPLVKISEDDILRLFGEEKSHSEVFEYFHSLNVDIICLTMGKKGVKLSQKGKSLINLPAIKINKVMDATGAGDAFWSGFLFAHIKGLSVQECLNVALKLAALKLQNVGRLPDNINILSELLE